MAKSKSMFSSLAGSASSPGTLPQERMSMPLGSVPCGGMRMDSTFEANDRRSAERAAKAKSGAATKPY